MESTAETQKAISKWFVVVLCALLVITISIGVTLAVMYRSTESRANNFTFGNLSIELIETKWDKLKPDDKVTYPGRSIVKDPKVVNTGKSDAYLYIEVSIPRAEIRTVNANQSINPPAFHDLFTYTVNSGWTEIGTGTVSADGKYTEHKYAYTAAIIAQGEATPTLFDKVTFVNALEGEPEKGTLLDIQVRAMGVQSGYLNESGNTLAEKIIDAYSIAKAQED